MIKLPAIIHQLLRLLVKQTECMFEASNIYLLFRHFSLTPLIWVGFDCFWKKRNTDFKCVLSCPNRRRMLRRQLPLSHSPHCGPWGQHPSSREHGDLQRSTQGQGQWGSQVPATGVHHWTDGETGRGWSFWSLQKVFFRGDLKGVPDHPGAQLPRHFRGHRSWHQRDWVCGVVPLHRHRLTQIRHCLLRWNAVRQLRQG